MPGPVEVFYPDVPQPWLAGMLGPHGVVIGPFDPEVNAFIGGSPEPGEVSRIIPGIRLSLLPLIVAV
jgi:hypothetical protein